jgi:hypothetical protein
VKYWYELKPACTTTAEWIGQGDTLGVYRLLSKEDLVTLSKGIGPAATASYFAANQRLDAIESDKDLFQEALRILLNSSGRFFSLRSPPDSRGYFISHFAVALDVSMYFYALATSAPSLHHVMQRRYYAYPGFASAESVRGVIDEDTICRIEMFLDVFAELSEQRANWSTTIAPWSRIVEAGLAGFDVAPIFIEIAAVGAGIRSKSDAGVIGDSLFDATVPLVERCRYARFRSGSPKWWATQLELADSAQKIELALVNLVSWGTTRTLMQLLEELSELLSHVSNRQFRRFLDIAGRHASDKASIKQTEFSRELRKASPRALALVARRANKSDADIVFENSLRNYRGTEGAISSLVADIAMRKAFANPDEWKDVLPIIKRLYQGDGVPEAALSAPASERRDLPIPIALDIVRDPENYPLRLIGIADASLTKMFGSMTKPIGQIARAEGWFGVGEPGVPASVVARPVGNMSHNQ